MEADSLTREVFEVILNRMKSPGLWSWGRGYMNSQQGEYDFSDDYRRGMSICRGILDEKRFGMRRLGDQVGI